MGRVRGASPSVSSVSRSVSSTLALGLALVGLSAQPAFAQVTFSSSTVPLAGLNVQAVATGDFNGDGILDLVVVQRAATRVDPEVVLVYRGDGAGGFPGAPVAYPVGNTPSDVAIVDLDLDGRLDLVVANRADDTVSVLMNVAGAAR